MSKKGFTLIELLAVIVILAIIALIATPIVLNIIKDSRDSATLRSAENYMDAVANAIATTNMKEGGDLSVTTCTIEESILNCPVYGVIDVDINKEKPKSGTIVFDRGKVVEVSLTYENGKTVVNDEKGNLEYFPEAVSFGTDLWNVIKANVNTGVYNVGDEKEVELDIDGDGTKTSYTLRIANLPSEEEKTEGCGTEGFSETACGFVVEFVDIISQYKMNPTYTNLGGYPASSMYTYIQNDIYNSLPEKLQAVIIPTYVVSSHGSRDTGMREDGNFESTDKLYLLSGKEVYGSDTDDTSADLTRQLDYYKNLNVTTSSYSGAIKKLNGTANWWWLRSAYSGNSVNFRGVCSDGDLNDGNANNASGVAVAFRIG